MLFNRFRELNIKVKPSKFRLGTRVKFRGFECKAKDGEVRIRPGPSRLKAIADIAAPKTKTEVRAFLGMTRQLEAWSPDLSFSSRHLRRLTIKSAAFSWDNKCQEEFLNIKKIIRDIKFISPFEKGLPLEMFCDASKEGGLEYLLVQTRKNGSKALAQCGSTSLTDAQARYSITKIKLLAVLWGMQKSAFYTRGAPLCIDKSA